MEKLKKESGELESAPSRWRRRERKHKPKMRVHGRGMKKLAGKLAEKSYSIN